ncbi:MAG TPA: uracil phosphoribosyltransferase [Chthoniobacterales bacterium]|nr:uracil phosphoribosyltransferase [Chthoniobacterales bacterium]
MNQATTSGAEVRVLDHPLAAVCLATLRGKTTPPNEFRPALRKLALLLLVEAARRWEMRMETMESPLKEFSGAVLARPIALVPILRAGLGLQEGMRPLIPGASIGHVGLYRDPATLRPIKYFSRLPANLDEAEVLVLDPMLATGGSAVEAVTVVKAAGATRVQLVCVLACPPGLAEMQRAHPEVAIVTVAIDPELNRAGYIVPGLGDAGDRYFGTD